MKTYLVTLTVVVDATSDHEASEIADEARRTFESFPAVTGASVDDVQEEDI